eukprot:s426_g5.t1
MAISGADLLEAATTVNDTEAFKKELEYIKREDVLDEAGRQRPILIQSTDSDLLEKLQVNEFLYEAQQARNPVPPMIEKIAQLLAMLHEGQQRADAYLGDLSKSNALVSAMRQRNMALFSRTQMFESFKSRALMRYVMNMVEGDRIHDLHLDGLSFGTREIKEMLGLFQRYECFEQVYVLSLIDNGLDDDAVNIILQVIFQLPYMRSFDLRRNCFSYDGVKRIEDQLRDMDGVTGVIKSADGAVNVHSGNQLRMTLHLGDQLEKSQLAKDVDFTVDQSLSHADADPFLETAASRSEHPWTHQGASASQRPPQKAVPDVSSVPLEKPTAAPAAPAVGGPPVGLGGPGNLAALNKKLSKSKTGGSLPDPKKRAKNRAKAAPPPMLEYIPRDHMDKWQVAPVQNSARMLLSASSPSLRRPNSHGVPRASMRSHVYMSQFCGATVNAMLSGRAALCKYGRLLLLPAALLLLRRFLQRKLRAGAAGAAGTAGAAGAAGAASRTRRRVVSDAVPRAPERLSSSLRSFDAVLVLGPRKATRELLELWSQIPFTAILTEAWSGDFEDFFPHSVGKNFGGFATILSKPRVDKPPGDSRPVLRLDGLGIKDVEDEDDEPPILIFLRDLFQSKVALLCGWPQTIPQGLVGRALKDAWQLTLARDLRRTEALAFALGPEARASQGGVRVLRVDETTELGFFDALVEEMSGNGCEEKEAAEAKNGARAPEVTRSVSFAEVCEEASFARLPMTAFHHSCHYLMTRRCTKVQKATRPFTTWRQTSTDCWVKSEGAVVFNVVIQGERLVNQQNVS